MTILMGKQSMSRTDGNVKSAWPPFLIKRLSEGSFILVLTFALFILFSLLTYDAADLKSPKPILNAGGLVGAYVANVLYFALGRVAFALPLGFTYLAALILQDHRALRVVDKPMFALRGVGLLLVLASTAGFLCLFSAQGGWFGQTLATGWVSILNLQGALLIFLALFLIGTTWLTGLSWIRVTEMIGRYSLIFLGQSIIYLKKITLLKEFILNFIIKNKTKIKEIKPAVIPKIPNLMGKTEIPRVARDEVSIPKPVRHAELSSLTEQKTPSLRSPSGLKQSSDWVATPAMQARDDVSKSIGLPSLSLLNKGVPSAPLGGHTHEALETLSRELEQHLVDFGIHADVVAVHPGPVITRFELQLAAGVKVSKLTALAKDLARSLSVTSVRVVEIIPGKTVVGLELPNQHRATVAFSDVLSADVYQQAHSTLTLALGVDIAGHPMVVDLGKMPHLLVAGTTGSGKSVGINAMILSLLFKSTPEQVRLIMVDPKMLELSVYDGIPHLLTPVVTDMKEAASALRWCVGEMERRYRLMASFGVRNLAGFNAKVSEALAKGERLVDPLWKPIDSMDFEAPALQPLPYIVVIIDELADMMMVVGKKVEQLIARIAQKARAAGIHLILATQRPSVDVLTGLIKSNIPTRISFQVSSKIDSRTILDQQGAEQLLGAGDMLFLAPGTGAPLRVHGAFIDDQEVHRVAADWRSRGAPQYIDEITQISSDLNESGTGQEEDTEDADPLYDEAVQFVLQTRKASTSAVQRRFKIGYNRAARLVDEMERTGVVGPLEGGFRDVLAPTSSEE